MYYYIFFLILADSGIKEKIDEEVDLIADKTGLKRWHVITISIGKYRHSLLTRESYNCQEKYELGK